MGNNKIARLHLSSQDLTVKALVLFFDDLQMYNLIIQLLLETATKNNLLFFAALCDIIRPDR